MRIDLHFLVAPGCGRRHGQKCPGDVGLTISLQLSWSGWDAKRCGSDAGQDAKRCNVSRETIEQAEQADAYGGYKPPVCGCEFCVLFAIFPENANQMQISLCTNSLYANCFNIAWMRKGMR